MSFIASLMILSGCSSLNLKDNISDVAGVTTAVVLTPVVGTPISIPAGIGVSAAVNSVTQEEPSVEIEKVTNVHQEEVAKAQVQADLIESLGMQGIIGAGAVFLIWTLLTWFIGARRARPEEYRFSAQRDELQRVVEAQSRMIAKMKE